MWDVRCLYVSVYVYAYVSTMCVYVCVHAFMYNKIGDEGSGSMSYQKVLKELGTFIWKRNNPEEHHVSFLTSYKIGPPVLEMISSLGFYSQILPLL